MKKIFVMALAVAAFTACSKEQENEPDNSPKEQLNILTTINTRALIEDATMPENSVIGVHVTQPDGGGVKIYAGENFVSGGTNLTPSNEAILETGANVNFTFDGTNWNCKTNDGSGAAKLMIGSATGTLYAYYPYNKDADFSTNMGENAVIPVTVETTGDINIDATPAAKSAYAAASEKDWLYYNPGATARATVSSASTTTAKLSMEHALARVSFRMYVSKDAPTLDPAVVGDANYYLMGYTIKNKTGKELLCASNTGATMNIATGAITTTADTKGGTIVRNIKQNSVEGYALTRFSGDITPEEKGDLIQVSNLVLPISDIASSLVNSINVSDDLEVVFTIRKGNGANGTTAETKTFTIPLIVTHETSGGAKDGSDMWLAGKNYIYTVKLNAYLGLSIDEVTVTKWSEIVGGDMTID